MYNVTQARTHLRSAIGCVIVVCLLAMMRSGPTNWFVWTLAAPALPFGLAIRAVDRLGWCGRLRLPGYHPGHRLRTGTLLRRGPVFLCGRALWRLYQSGD